MHQRALLFIALQFCACAASTPDLATEEMDPDEREPGGARIETVSYDPSETNGSGPAAEESDLTDAALIASGYESPAHLRSARARFETIASPIVEALKAIPGRRERAKMLLEALHQKGGFLGEYDARATTLAEILDRRRYNCVSASVIYNLLAERLELESFAQLLPTHARTVLQLDEKKRGTIIETTSPDGFDPDPRMQATILQQVGGALSDGRALVPDGGSIVSTRVLIGTIYVNRASIVQEAGDLELAERLFGRGETYAGTPDMLRVLRDQRAALLSQLGANDVLSEDPKRIDRAYRTIKAAVALEPDEPQIRAAVLQNLRAAAERKIHEIAQKKDEKAVLAIAGEAAGLGLEPSERSGLRAFSLSEVARMRIDASDFDGAVDAIELALKEQLSPRDLTLRKTLEQNRVSALRLAAFTAAKKGDYARSMAMIERIRGLPGLTTEQRGDTAADQLRVIHLVGNKRIDDSDFLGALEVYREGVRRFPGDPTCRHNLVAVLERLALPLASRAECAKADEYLEEIRVNDPGSKFASGAKTKCLMERARQRLDAKDYAEAVSLMRAARATSPAEPSVTTNLAVALLRWTQSLSQSGSCARAVTLVRELKSLAVSTVEDAEIRRALGACRD